MIESNPEVINLMIAILVTIFQALCVILLAVIIAGWVLRDDETSTFD